MNLYKNLIGRQALVAGASTGIGWAISQMLMKEQVKVVIADINPPEEKKDQFTFIPVDLTDPGASDKVFTQLAETDSLPDILICNVGRGIQEKLTEGDPAKWQGIIDLNLMSHLRLIRTFVPQMLSMKMADVVFTSSVAANQPHPYGGIYSASKAALVNIAETLRQECTPDLRVTTITPGVVKSDFFNNQIGSDTTAESFGWGYLEPADIAESIVFALSRPQEVAINNITIRPRAQVF